MPEERLPDAAPAADPPRETGGEYLFRVLKPAGAVFVLVLGLLFLVVCFTWRNDPLRDYAPPHDSEYYAAHPDELERELRSRLLPYLPDCETSVRGAAVELRAAAEDLEKIRETLSGFYDESLFILKEK